MKRSSILFVALTLTGCSLIELPDTFRSGTPSASQAVPAEGANNVPIAAAVKIDLNLPNGGLNLTSVSNSTVTLTNAATGDTVPATVSVFNDAEVLTLTPATTLEFGTEYQFEISASVEDEAGQAFKPFNSTFTTVSADVPSIIEVTPADGARNVAVDTSIRTGLNGVVDKTTVTVASVYLTDLSTGERVSGGPGSSGAGDSLTLQTDTLKAGTEYQFNVTSAVLDTNGQPFTPFTSTYITSSEGSGATPPPAGNIAVVPQGTAAGERHSSLTVGPDGNLYATTIDGRILRYPIEAGGSLGAPETLTSLQDANGGTRLTVGLTFDPAATADNLIVWVTHTEFGPINNGQVRPGVDAPWAGKLTRLSGPNLENVQDYVVGLPRSVKDHVTNSVAFNPAEPGVIYFIQGSNTAMGAPDRAWDWQEERVLSNAVLRLDTNLLGGNLPLNAQSEDGGSYDPFVDSAPLTVYASGIRNSYDLVWHSSGNLYVPANGSARRGIAPRYAPLPDTCERRIDGRPYTGPMLSDANAVSGYISEGPNGEPTDGWVIEQTLSDFLFKIEQGGYYGTPNPKRCEWVLNGGGIGFPGVSSTVIKQYPSDLEYDPNYRGPAYDFGQNISPNGVIEYQGDAFSQFSGDLLVVRYATGDNIVALSLDNQGNVEGEAAPVVPNGTFGDPIDLTEDSTTGYLYVSSYDELGQAEGGPGISLVRPE